MFILECDVTVFVDVDDTLIKWENDPTKETIKVECDGTVSYLNPIWSNVEYIITHKTRGHKVVVWSLGGYKWAVAAVKALGIEQHVDVIMAKPRWIIDDLEASEWMPKASFKHPQPVIPDLTGAYNMLRKYKTKEELLEIFPTPLTEIKIEEE